MRTSAAAFLLAAVLAAPALALGQASETATEAVKRQAGTAVSDPSLTSDASSGKPQVTLLSESDSTTAAGEIGLAFSDVTTLILRIEAPLEKGSEETTFADLDGLRGGTQATFGFTHYFLNVSEEDLKELLPICDEYNASPEAAGPVPVNIAAGECTLDTLEKRSPQIASTTRQKIQAGLDEFCAERRALGLPHMTACTPEAFEALAEAGEKEWKAKADEATKMALEAGCKAHNSITKAIDSDAGKCTYQVLDSKGPQWGRRALKILHPKPAFIFSLRGSIQNDRFKVAEAPELKRETVSKNSVALRGALGAVLGPLTYAGVNVRLERAFEGASSTQICSPIPDTTSLGCFNAATKQPTREDHQIVQGEIRYQPTPWLGLNPRVSYDFHDSVTGVQLLAYFLTSKKAGLNGGVDIGYRSDEKKLLARVFIGAAFGVIP